MKDDPTLRKQLMNLDRIKSNRKFEPWKATFVKRFENFLEKEGLKNAESAYESFRQVMERTTKLVQKCEEMHQIGVLTNERATVKGRRALNEMVNDFVVCHAQIKKLIPGDCVEEEELGYNKFHLGAILVRDNFSEYEKMKHVNDAIQIMTHETLTQVADRVHVEQFGNYQKEFNSFCAILNSLGLYEVMMACRKFSDEEEVEDDDDSLTEDLTELESLSEMESFVECILVVDMKTASVFQMPIDLAFEKKLLSSDSSSTTTTKMVKEAVTSKEEKEGIKRKLKKHPTLGVSTSLVIQKTTNMENEYTELNEKEAVANLWGVSLKSTHMKKKKNEELFFFDPETGAVGELDRSKALQQKCITEIRNQYNRLTLEEAVENGDEWEAIIGKIRKIMGIRIGDIDEEESSGDEEATTQGSGRSSF